jgi:hypothetical protein
VWSIQLQSVFFKIHFNIIPPIFISVLQDVSIPKSYFSHPFQCPAHCNLLDIIILSTNQLTNSMLLDLSCLIAAQLVKK